VNPADPADETPELPDPGNTITQLGDLWYLGVHRILCADVRDRGAVRRLMAAEPARMVLTDPPYNVPVDGHVSGLGRARHQAFACASGDLSPAEFTDFLEVSMCEQGSIPFADMSVTVVNGRYRKRARHTREVPIGRLSR
jgi:hypothetical protein